VLGPLIDFGPSEQGGAGGACGIPDHVMARHGDAKKFPMGPWCKKGQWVMIGRYAGARFKIEGGEVRIINDDEVIATIADPADVMNV
jgi:hypothetical protein